MTREFPRSKENVLAILLKEEPSALSPYGLYGNPPMWLLGELDGMELYARPCKTQERGSHGMYQSVDGISWQFQKNGKWHDQAIEGSFETFFNWFEKRYPETSIEEDGPEI